MKALCDYLNRELGVKYTFSILHDSLSYKPFIKVVLINGNTAKYSLHYRHDAWNHNQIYTINEFGTNNQLEELVGNV